MMMIKMTTIEENVQNTARCSPMWASRPVLPPASGQIWLPSSFFSDFEDTSKMGPDYEDDVPRYNRKRIQIICTQEVVALDRPLCNKPVEFSFGAYWFWILNRSNCLHALEYILRSEQISCKNNCWAVNTLNAIPSQRIQVWSRTNINVTHSCCCNKN